MYVKPIQMQRKVQKISILLR